MDRDEIRAVQAPLEWQDRDTSEALPVGGGAGMTNA